METIILIVLVLLIVAALKAHALDIPKLKAELAALKAKL